MVGVENLRPVEMFRVGDRLATEFRNGAKINLFGNGEFSLLYTKKQTPLTDLYVYEKITPEGKVTQITSDVDFGTVELFEYELQVEELPLQVDTDQEEERATVVWGDLSAGKRVAVSPLVLEFERLMLRAKK